MRKRFLQRTVGLSAESVSSPPQVCYNEGMNTISVDEIQGDLTGCLQRVQAGETLLIMQFGQPVAEIIPVKSLSDEVGLTPRPYGLAKGEFIVPDDFDDPLPEDILRDFEGR